MGGLDIDSIKYRKYLWNKEYSTRKALPSSNTFHPSSSLRRFIEKYPRIKKDKALDIGAGNGRNAFYLIQNGFKYVKAIDLSPVAIDLAKQEAKRLGLADRIDFIANDAALEIGKDVNSYSLIIDMTTLHSMTKSSRRETVKHIKRLIAPNGYYLIFTLLANSPAVVDLKAKMPGPEENSYRFKFEEDTITEKAFTKGELEKLFSPLKLIEYEEYQTVTRAYKGEFPRIYITCLFQI